MQAEMILLRLEGVRKRQEGQWAARCPAHDDKSPSLSIRENPDGRVLLHCFGGCHVRAVVDALGITMDSLFPPSTGPGGGAGPLRKRGMLTASQALEMLADESMIVTLVASDIAARRPVRTEDRNRVRQAAARVAYLLEQTRA